jgi:hypothetical protein
MKKLHVLAASLILIAGVGGTAIVTHQPVAAAADSFDAGQKIGQVVGGMIGGKLGATVGGELLKSTDAGGPQDEIDRGQGGGGYNTDNNDNGGDNTPD